jgi:hypothetical protein
VDVGSDRQLQEPGRYEVRVQGHLDPRWSTSFDGLAIRHDRNGTTVLYGEVADQAALHGVLRKVRDLGLLLVSVNEVVATDQTDQRH